jgi:leader peptidase (prepilin peptidase)/N-methyltransferase
MFDDFGSLQQVVLISFVGICVGSFLNVVIYRLPRGKSVIAPSSRCGTCRTPLSIVQNIPLISYLCLRGRCGACGAPYSVRYFGVELLTPLLFLLVWYFVGFNILSAILMAFAALLLAASLIDIDLRIIPDSLSLGAWGVALMISAISVEFPVSFVESLIGSAVGYLLFFVLSRGYFLVMGDEGLGGGDVKFMGLIGAVLGWEGVVTTMFFASLVGAVFGLILILIFGKSRKYPLPFGPFLAAGAFVHSLGFSLISYMERF